MLSELTIFSEAKEKRNKLLLLKRPDGTEQGGETARSKTATSSEKRIFKGCQSISKVSDKLIFSRLGHIPNFMIWKPFLSARRKQAEAAAVEMLSYLLITIMTKIRRLTKDPR